MIIMRLAHSFRKMIITVLLTAVGCGHVVHRAGVEPGGNVSFMYGPAYQTYYAPPPHYWEPRKKSNWESTDTQLNLGYAWRFENDKRLLVQALFLARSGINDRLLANSIDLYYQTKTSPGNAGIGLLVGLDPRFYFMWGKERGRPGSAWGTSLDAGLGVGLIYPSFISQIMYGVRFHGLRTSLFAEYRYFFFNTEVFDDENSSAADNLKSRFMLGIVMSIDGHR